LYCQNKENLKKP